jgi:hypothetical protein
LHSLVDHGQQLGVQHVQVHLVTQAGPEGLDDPGRVVAAAVEPPFHRGLDAAAGRLEQRGHGQGGGRHNQGGLPAEMLAQPEDDEGIATAQ